MAGRPTRPWVAVVGLLVAAVVALWFGNRAAPAAGSGAPADRSVTGSAPTRPATPNTQPTTGPLPPAAAAEVERLRAAPTIVPTSSSTRITGETTTQPDLYAAEFVRRLLSQDYSTSRSDLLAWVQTESAQSLEPLVVGLVPAELRDRLAVYSVTDTTSGPPPIPTAREWAALAATGTTQTVQVDAVRIPLAWSNAVAAGRITDPGVTGREVLATVTRHTGSNLTRWSVAITLNLEGPPTRPAWGFVTAVTFRAVQMGVGS